MDVGYRQNRQSCDLYPYPLVLILLFFSRQMFELLQNLFLAMSLSYSLLLSDS